MKHHIKQCKKLWTLVALAIMQLVAPAVSAEEQEYTVRPSTSETPSATILILNSMTQSQTKTHYSNVGSGVNYLEVDLGYTAYSIDCGYIKLMHTVL